MAECIATQELVDLVLSYKNPLSHGVLENREEETPVHPPAEIEDNRWHLFERGVRLSESIIWKLQEEAYDTQGVDAWDSVPFFVTTNTFIAENYADMILSFLKDIRHTLDMNEPLYIVELASGPGILSFHLLNALLRKIACFRELKHLKLCYVLTDITENNAQFWESHDRLSEYIADGVLDTAIFRADVDNSLYLRNSQTVISRETVKNPIISLANYLFDCIRQDMFRISNHELHETFFTFYRDLEQHPLNSTVTTEQLQCEATHFPISTQHYEDDRLNDILRYYCEKMENATVYFPIAALNCIRNLQHLSNDRLVLISSDKGFTDRSYMTGHWVPSYSCHGEFLSYMVNFNAVQRFFELQGGKSFAAGDQAHSLKTVFCVLLQDESYDFEELSYMFQHRVRDTSPINCLFSLRDLASARDEEADPTKVLMAAISYIQMSRYEPASLSTLGAVIVKMLAKLTVRNSDIETLLLKTVAKVKANIFDLRQSSNAWYWVGKVMYSLREFAQAVEAFHHSLELYGKDSFTLYFLACCYEEMKEYSKAMRYYRETLEYEPKCEHTLQGIKRVRQFL